VHYVHKDHLGSTALTTDEHGKLLHRYAYLPYGAVLASDNHRRPEIARDRFAAMELDASSGLYNAEARLYDPALGRFLSPDPAGPVLANPQSGNRYAYALNNPMRYVDPTGRGAADPGSMGVDRASDRPTPVKENRPSEPKAADHADPVVADKTTSTDSKGVGRETSHSEAAVNAGIGIVAVGSVEMGAGAAGGGAAAGLLTGPAAPVVIGAIVVTAAVIDYMNDSAQDESSALSKKKEENGSYTIEDAIGNRYHGKGPPSRMEKSARDKEKQTGERIVKKDWTPSASEREAFKDEARRIENDSGVENPRNYNKRNSPGKRFREEDGD
jgi:RHS repeat-associated protein